MIIISTQILNDEIVEYVENTILPKYQNFDLAHKIDHAKAVISNSLDIAKEYDVDINMVYVIAAYHDLGLINGRENHHIDSGIILADDKYLKSMFSIEDINLMSQAVEDHRASNDYEPRSIYGKIVSTADRDLKYHNIIRRTSEFSVSNFPEHSFEEHMDRCIDHLNTKYGEYGYVKLWLDDAHTKNLLKILRAKIAMTEDVIADFTIELNRLI
ncbi:MAG: HD domain-containing protein [Tissierellia bacterium]|nr:HD domain-containing protein [Tissierellia bacterium]